MNRLPALATLVAATVLAAAIADSIPSALGDLGLLHAPMSGVLTSVSDHITA
jgi:hypothetical protein